MNSAKPSDCSSASSRRRTVGCATPSLARGGRQVAAAQHGKECPLIFPVGGIQTHTFYTSRSFSLPGSIYFFAFATFAVRRTAQETNMTGTMEKQHLCSARPAASAVAVARALRHG